ncbi:MAG: polysaccharide deacetylase family protein [Candidatus Nanoarchaeia archaeon]
MSLLNILPLPRRTGSIYFHGSRKYNKIALTFDDCPSEDTSKILNLLDKEGIKACFFIQGNLGIKRRKIIRRIIKEGHDLGNHTFSHKSSYFKSKKYIKRELQRVDKLYQSSLVRPPYLHIGMNFYSVCKELDKKIIACDVVSDDWKLKGIDYCVNNILNNVKPGSIINLHDYITGVGRNKYLINILKRVVPELKKRGYSFVKISDILQQ